MSLILRYIGENVDETFTKDYDDLRLWDDLVERCDELTNMQRVQIWLCEEGLPDPIAPPVTLDEVLVWEKVS